MIKYVVMGIKKYLLGLFLIGCMFSLQAATFTSSDDQLTLELPSGWVSAKKPTGEAVLSVVKDKARIDIKKVPECKTEECLEKKAQADLAAVKAKKMEIVGNSYTGEEIMRMDFSTGEPLFYISFFTPKNDFSAGYFMLNKQPYSILVKDLTYAQAELIFSFISPANKNNQSALQPQEMEMDLSSERAYDIDSMPQVQEENLVAPVVPADRQTASTPAKVQLHRFSKNLPSLVTPQMPRYVQKLGRCFDLLILLILVYVVLFTATWVVRLFIRPRQLQVSSDAHSAYPIYFRRRYGTPSLIFRAKDNQGNILLSLTSRWDSLFLFSGTMLVLFSILVLAFTSVSERLHWLPLSNYTYLSISSAAALIIPLGFIIFLCGVLWAQLVLRQFSIYDNKGHRIVYVAQRGLGFRTESYCAYFLKTREIFFLKRRCFSLLHDWTLFDKDNNPLAHLVETSKTRAILRKLFGHLWGFLHADYVIYFPDGSKGAINNEHARFNRFIATVENPAILAARDLLVAALIINIRDRDKWYPWF